MNDKDFDEIIKNKFKNAIKPSKEFEQNIMQKINEQKLETKQNTVKNNIKIYKRMSMVLAMAAIFILVFVAVLNLERNNSNVFNKKENSFVKIKAIEATKVDRGVIENDSEFIITVEGENSTVENVQRSLYVEPALEYDIVKTGDSEFKLSFKQNIPDNTILKLQYVKNQITEDSWAYQTTNKLSVNKTYPANDTNYASKNSVIEIELSYANVEKFEENISITPNIEGKWEHLGKTWRFTPSNEMEDGFYVVKLNKGISADDKTLEEDYVFSFQVCEKDYSYYETVSLDKIITSTEDEKIKIYGNVNSVEKVFIFKLNDSKEFLDYLNNKTYDTSKQSEEYSFNKTERVLELDKKLQLGYYVASAQTANGKELFNVPIQINNLQAYVLGTERDIMAWVAVGNSLAEGINVEYLGKTIKTNSEGIALFEDVIDGSEKIKYVKIGNDENQLIVGIYNFTDNNYPNGYIYTDRPVYKNTDTINIWGFVPRKLFYEEVEEEFYIKIGNMDKQKINVSKEGSFDYKFDLKNYADKDYLYITLYYKESAIAYTNVKVENYELQNYNYDVIINKNYGFDGERLEFDVKVTHITGLPAINKSVIVDFQNNEQRLKTNEKGIAHVSIELDYDKPYCYLDYEEIGIYNGDLEEYNVACTYAIVYILPRDVYCKTDIDRDNKKVNVDLYKLEKEKNMNIEKIEDLFSNKYDTDIDVYLIENVTTRTIERYEFDEYTKQNEPIYKYSSTNNETKISTVRTNNGNAQIDLSSIQYNKSSADVHYYYELELRYLDTESRETVSMIYGIITNYSENTNEGYVYYDFESGEREGNVNLPIYNSYSKDSYYDFYRFILNPDDLRSPFSIGDTVNLKLKQYSSGNENEIQNEGKVLRIVMQENISKMDVISDNNFGYTFTDNDFPGCKITGVYYLEGKFYRMPVFYYDFDELDRKVDIDIKLDKDEYKPKDEVTIKIKTSKNGQAVSSVVNVSVVNEAVFAAQGENNNSIIEELYKSKTYPAYTYSSYADYLNCARGGGRRWRRFDKGKICRHSIFWHSSYRQKWKCYCKIQFTR